MTASGFSAADAEQGSGDDIDKDKCNHGRKCAAGTFLCPGTADGHGKEDMQVIDDGPPNGFHGPAQGKDKIHVAASHLHQFSHADHQSGSRHDCDYGHQHLAQLLEEIKVNGEFGFFLFGFRGCLAGAAYGVSL